MFGGFSLEWEGKKIAAGKSKESQFSYLMQMVLHYRREGVPKEELKAVVFEERDLENANHALRSIIYNARKKLASAGMPEGHEGEEAAYVVSGSINILLEDTCIALSAGDSLRIPPLTQHRWINSSTEDAVIIFAVSPPSF